VDSTAAVIKVEQANLRIANLRKCEGKVNPF
jgi:hypothetical protein